MWSIKKAGVFMETMILLFGFIDDIGNENILSMTTNPSMAQIQTCVKMVDNNHFCEAGWMTDEEMSEIVIKTPSNN